MAGEDLRRYPDASTLEADLARRHGVQPDEVLVTAGGDDAIDRLCRRYLQGGRTLNLTAPTFSMFFHHARLAGGNTCTVPWWSGAYPVAAMADSVGEDTGLVAVVSPNNPTGAVLTPEELTELRRATGDRVLLLDAAYAEFGEIDLTSLALSLPQTLVLRTLSKAWGLAGLRVGYLLGPAAILKELRAWGAPYAVAGTSLALARQALGQGDPAMQATITAVRRNRDRLAGLLGELGACPQESQANFILCRPPRADFLIQGLVALGVSVRGWKDDAELRDRVRITVPACPQEYATLERALRCVLAPEALLLDMDGVIADEGPSYRETIIQVAADEGVALTRQAIAAAKAAGGANNDWELTRRLLAQRGVRLSLMEVTRRFQDIYLGTAGKPGLCARETLIPDRSVLEGLARTLPLAIVTGRPRADAEAFLRRFDLEGLFQTVICLEDATPKPDPAPVNLACRNLGVRRAWMVGDTPDDIVAARGAGVLPLGIAPPSPLDDTREALAQAGAALILPSLTSLKEILP
jgi:histidinol-phosphate aminotransferase